MERESGAYGVNGCEHVQQERRWEFNAKGVPQKVARAAGASPVSAATRSRAAGLPQKTVGETGENEI